MEFTSHQQGGDNQILSMISEGLYNVALDARRLVSGNPNVNEISAHQHCLVAEAIANRDSEAAHYSTVSTWTTF